MNKIWMQKCVQFNKKENKDRKGQGRDFFL